MDLKKLKEICKLNKSKFYNDKNRCINNLLTKQNLKLC